MMKVSFSFFQRRQNERTKETNRKTQLGMGKGGTMSQHNAAIRLNKKTKERQFIQVTFLGHINMQNKDHMVSYNTFKKD